MRVFGHGLRGCRRVEGRGVTLFPPFSTGGSGVCPGLRWDVAPRFLVWFAGGARGLGFRFRPVGLAEAVWRVVLSGFSLTPARGVSFPRLGCVVALSGAGSPSAVPEARPIRCARPSLTWVVVRLCLSRGAVPSAVGGCVGVAVGGGFPPPCPFSFRAFRWGTFCPSWGGGCRLVAWWLVSPVSGCAPRPFVQLFFPVPVAGDLPLSRQGCALACPECLFLYSFSGCVVLVGRFVLLGVVRLGGMVFQCPIGGSRERPPWCCQASGGLSASALGVRGFTVVWLSLLLPSVPPGWQLCFRRVGCAVLPFSIRRWVRFPRFPVVLVFFWGGGVCLFLRLQSLSMHWSVSWLVNWLAFRVAGGRGPCPGFRAPCGLCTLVDWWPILLGLGLGSPGWTVAPAVILGSWVRGGGGWGTSLGCPVSPLCCGIGLVLVGSTFPWWFVLAGRCGFGAGVLSRFSLRSPVPGRTGCCCSLEPT